MQTPENNSANIKLFLAKLDERIHSDKHIWEVHEKFKTKLFFQKGSYTDATHHFYIKKILKYIDYFLSTGPLTENEHKLFISAVELMKEYYVEQLNRTTQEDVFYPNPNTPVYALFFSKNVESKQITIRKT